MGPSQKSWVMMLAMGAAAAVGQMQSPARSEGQWAALSCPLHLFTAGLSQADAVYSGGKVLPQVNLFWKHPHRTFLRQVPYLIPDSSRGQPVLTISACLVYRCQPYGQPCTCGTLSGSPPFFCMYFSSWLGAGSLLPSNPKLSF